MNKITLFHKIHLALAEYPPEPDTIHDRKIIHADLISLTHISWSWLPRKQTLTNTGRNLPLAHETNLFIKIRAWHESQRWKSIAFQAPAEN